MKKLAYWLCAILFVVTCNLIGSKAYAVEEEGSTEANSAEEVGLTIDVEIGISTVGMDMLSGEKISNRITVQPLVTVSYGDAYIGAQLTTSNFDKRLTENDENYIDVYAGVEKEIFDGVTIDTGIGFSDVQNSVGDLWYVYLSAELEAIISPYISLEFDVPTDEETLEGGFLYRVGGKYSWNEILFDLSIGGHDGAYGYDAELVSHSRLTVSKDFSVWDHTITPALHAQKSFDEDGIADDMIWVELRLAF